MGPKFVPLVIVPLSKQMMTWLSTLGQSGPHTGPRLMRASMTTPPAEDEVPGMLGSLADMVITEDSKLSSLLLFLKSIAAGAKGLEQLTHIRTKISFSLSLSHFYIYVYTVSEAFFFILE